MSLAGIKVYPRLEFSSVTFHSALVWDNVFYVLSGELSFQRLSI